MVGGVVGAMISLLLELAVFTEASGEKSEGQRGPFFAISGKSSGGKKCNTLVPAYLLPGPN
jgi:hypothetical protein